MRVNRTLLLFATAFFLFLPFFASAQITVTLGPEEMVFDWSTQNCEAEDIPDLPARAFRDNQNKVQLIATHNVNRRFIGNSLSTVVHQCPVIMSSSNDPNPANYNHKEWIAAPYTLDGQTVYALVHNEFQGQAVPGSCMFSTYPACWYNAITLAQSTNRGVSYTQLPTPQHLVASVPYQYNNGAGYPFGYFNPSNIIQKDGYYYSIIHAENHMLQQHGACVMRTQNLADPTSWRFWNGANFTNIPVNPYPDPVANPGQHVCAPVSNNNPDLNDNIGAMAENVSWNTYLQKWVLVGTHNKFDVAVQNQVYGFYFTTSDDLINWSSPQIIMQALVPWAPTTPAGLSELYPSLLDETTNSTNFEVTGQHPYLYFSRKNAGFLDRDLIRRQIHFSVPPPTVTISATDPNASETGPDTGTFSIIRSVITTTPLTVNLSLSGTAANNVDYTNIPSTAIIPANAGSVTITVTPIDDLVVEPPPPETVILTLQSFPANYTVGSPSAATVTITDNDVTPQPPAAPTSLGATANSSSQITLAWTDASNNETGFAIELRVPPNVFFQTAIVSADATSFVVTGLSASTAYEFRVRATNAVGNSSYSNAANATTLSVPPPPPPTPLNPVTNLSATTNSQSQITLTWTDNTSNETGFKIERRTLPNDTFSQIILTSANATSYVDNIGLSAGISYEYRVRATNNSGDSLFSNTASATTLSPMPVPPPPSGVPAAPTNFDAVILDSTIPARVRYTWTDNSNNETRFELFWRDLSIDFRKVNESPISFTYHGAGLAANTTYEWKVRACNVVGCSNFSNVVRRTMPAGSSSYTFIRTLRQGMSGADVKRLQECLNENGTVITSTGSGSPGNETTYFGARTHAAVIRFQNKYPSQILGPAGISGGTGVVGSLTRGVLNGLGCVAAP